LFSWVWCLLPPGAKYIWSVSLRFYLNAFHISWDGISLEPHVKAIRAIGMCEHIYHILTGTRVFLYPHTFLFLPQKSGIHCKIERGAETTLGIAWDPLIASSEQISVKRCGLRTTISDMLDRKCINNKIQGYYDQLPVVSPLIHIGLGVARLFDTGREYSNRLDFPTLLRGQMATIVSGCLPSLYLFAHQRCRISSLRVQPLAADGHNPTHHRRQA